MANLNLKFLRGLQNSLPTTGTDGYFYLTTDTHRLYTSIDGKVVPVNEGVVTVANLAALTSITDAKAGDFFYCTEENILCVFNGQTFVQINPDTGATSVEVVGNGNAVTAASYDAATRKLTLTKGETFALPADISTAVGELGDYENVKAYVDAKTTGIASDDDLSALAERVTTAEGEIDVLQEASHTHTFVDSDVEDAIAKKHNHTFIDTDVQDAISKKHSHTFVESELNKIVDGDVAKWNAVAADHLTSADKTTLENAIKEAKKAGTDANTNIETYKVTNDARVKAIEDDYLVEADKTELAGLVTAEKERAEGVESGFETRIKAIEDDYLTSADKTELEGKITAEETRAKGVEESLQTQINTIMNNPDAEGAINSINEFTQYVAEHGTIAEGMRTDINKNKEDIAVNAKAIADETTRATGVEEGLAGRIKDLEDNKAGYATTGEVATAKSEAISAAETKSAELDEALKTELQAEIEAAKTDSNNKDAVVLAEAQAYADQAEADAIASAAIDATNKVNALAETVYTKEEVEAMIEAAHTWGSF